MERGGLRHDGASESETNRGGATRFHGSFYALSAQPTAGRGSAGLAEVGQQGGHAVLAVGQGGGADERGEVGVVRRRVGGDEDDLRIEGFRASICRR